MARARHAAAINYLDFHSPPRRAAAATILSIYPTQALSLSLHSEKSLYTGRVSAAFSGSPSRKQLVAAPFFALKVLICFSEIDRERKKGCAGFGKVESDAVCGILYSCRKFFGHAGC